MAALVNTVLGKINVDSLGKTLCHEHFVYGCPGFEGDCTLGGYNRDKALASGLEIAEKLKKCGVKTVIDATTNDNGRNPLLYKEISEKSGLQIICCTGYYFEGGGSPPYFRRWLGKGGEEAIYEMFMAEITDGIAGTGIIPGVIKVASSKNIITDYEKAFFKAAVKVQKETDIPIITHTQNGTMGPEQAELLLSEGANPAHIIIGHMCACTDIAELVKTLKYGVTLGFDQFGLDGVGAPTDEVRKASLIGLIGLGYGNRLVLSHDTVIYWMGRDSQPKPSVKTWYMTHLFDNVVPSLKNTGLTDQQINVLFDDNVKHIFAG
ncbi:MAG: hypothetical protein LBF78_11140 [Treponema sp.]|jgi:phosphotriesterase-related protein|nr:hypothetical protein [Treponema sp.]